MEQKQTTRTYRVIRRAVRFFYPSLTLQGVQNIPDEPAIFVGNHAQMNGPIAAELYMPVERYTWCAGEMMDKNDVAAYAFRDFWSQKPKRTHWFYKCLAHAITPLAVCIFNNANTVAVHRDNRVLSTFRDTVRLLSEGWSMVIFPEHDQKYNHVVYDFQDRFIDVAKLYYGKTGKAICFVPMYLAPKLKTLCFGSPVRFDPEAPIADERARIKAAMMGEITRLADALPLHTVIPYRNIPKKLYPKNHPQEGPHT